jgi:hypothetical protein
MKRLTVIAVDPAPSDVHRRPLRSELPQHARAALALRVRIRLGIDLVTDGVAGVVVPPQALDLIRGLRIPFSTTSSVFALAAGYKGVEIDWIDIRPGRPLARSRGKWTAARAGAGS